MTFPNVCFLMSVYHRDLSIQVKEAIDSILTQQYAGKIVLYVGIDGCVSNAVNELLSIYAKRPDVRILRNAVNGGLGSILNDLIDEALKDKLEFEFFFRMDSDDISRLNRVKNQVKFMTDNSNVSISGGYCHEFGHKAAKDIVKVPSSHQELLKYSVTRCPFLHPTVVFRRVVLAEGNRYPTANALAEDISFWHELLLQGYTFSNIDEILLDFRVSEGTFRRRSGFSKAISEFRLRLSFSKKARVLSSRLFCLLLLRFCVQLLPVSILKVLYKSLR